MKKNLFKITAAVVIAALMSVSMMTGCKDNNTETEAALAIDKINPRSPEESLPGGYRLFDYDEENQGKFYLGDMSQVIIRAYNNKEELVDMAAWADNACANLVVSNIVMYARDTDFHDPEDVKVCGFDGIRYDCDMKAYTQFDEEGHKLEEGSYLLKGRNYFFYSDKDAYVLMFECYADDWDEQVAVFEEFIKDLEVKKSKK